ncbi:MAG: YybH family protein [Gemmatimonadota bacterium]
MVLEGVEDLFEAWVDAVTSRDSARVARLHLPSGIFQITRMGAVRGPDSIRRSCAEWLCRDGCEPSFALLETHLYGTADIATGNGRFTLSYRPGSNGKNGKKDTGRLLLVAEKDRHRWGLRFSGLFSDTYIDELATFRS